MSAVDFEAWTLDGLDIMLRGSIFTVEPPSTGAMGQLYALAAQAEVELRLARGPVPDEVKRVIAAIGPDEHPALGAAWQQMVDAGINPAEIDRAKVYSIFYWTHGKAVADAVATMYFAKAKPTQEDAPAPKARPRSPRKSGRSTGKASRSTTT